MELYHHAANKSQIIFEQFLRRMEKDDTFVAYEDNNYLLMTDSANDIEIVKKAILKMLQPNIYFDID